jgi:hypothetical protein
VDAAAIADARVDPDGVKAGETGSNKYRLEFTPIDAVKPETPEYDLTKRRED